MIPDVSSRISLSQKSLCSGTKCPDEDEHHPEMKEPLNDIILIKMMMNEDDEDVFSAEWILTETERAAARP